MPKRNEQKKNIILTIWSYFVLHHRDQERLWDYLLFGIDYTCYFPHIIPLPECVQQSYFWFFISLTKIVTTLAILVYFPPDQFCP